MKFMIENTWADPLPAVISKWAPVWGWIPTDWCRFQYWRFWVDVDLTRFDFTISLERAARLLSCLLLLLHLFHCSPFLSSSLFPPLRLPLFPSPSCCLSSSFTNPGLSGCPPFSPSSVSWRWGRITRSFQQRLRFVSLQLWTRFHCMSVCYLPTHPSLVSLTFSSPLQISISLLSHCLSVVHFCCFHVSLALSTSPVLGGIVSKLISQPTRCSHEPLTCCTRCSMTEYESCWKWEKNSSVLCSVLCLFFVFFHMAPGEERMWLNRSFWPH